MEAETGQDQQALLTQLAAARERLDGLVRDLRAIDAELEALATERRQHRLLLDVCASLEELGGIGGAELFWGQGTTARGSEDQIRRVRSVVDLFEKRVSEIEARGQVVLQELERHEDFTSLLEYDVRTAEDEEERRQQEWIVEREESVLPGRTLIMPWARSGEEDQRFRRSLAVALLCCLLLALISHLVEVPLHPLGEEVEVPDRVVRMMMEALPPPPAVEETLPLPEEKLAEEKPAEEAVPAKSNKEGPGVGPATGPAKGILAFREKFSGIAEKQTLARLGSQARIQSPGGTSSGRVERSMVTTQAPGSSGGINLASLSRGLAGGGGGGGSIATIQIARVTSSLGGGGGSDRPLSGDGPGLSRTDEEIQIVFDRHKAALYRLYNRELRRDPTLKGQMVLRMRIEPDGSVSLCELQASDMNAPQLSAQVLERVKTFDFGSKEGISAITILYPIDFLPAA